MKGHECYHCKQWVAEGEAHDCWTTTERALTPDLTEDLQEAYERLREAAVELGEQRVYASHNSIMFARKACYFFVRPKRKFLELVIFLGRPIRSPLVRKVVESSKVKRAHVVHVTHRDEVEPPLTEWLQEAYQFEAIARTIKPPKSATKTTAARPKAKPRTRAAKTGRTR
jgi:hypothetical protein